MRQVLLIICLTLIIIGCEKKNIPPTCVISNPKNETTFRKGDTITISVDAHDSDGIIHEVQFYIA